MTAHISRVAGSLVEATPMQAALFELAYIGDRQLLGEVVRQRGDKATLQVYEDTTGLAIGEPVTAVNASLMAHLGPGLLGAVLDGIGRPLERLAQAAGNFISPGARASTLDVTRQWTFTATRASGDVVQPGDVLGTVEEGPIVHRILVPPTVTGKIAALLSGNYDTDASIGSLDDGTVLRLAHVWPVRTPRPLGIRRASLRPFITGQRVFDLFFPVAEGGSAAIPGGFGTGKTIIEQSLAKYADADIVVYVGCGERGNEMTDVLTEFPELIDPRTGNRVMDRAVLIVNTSNMPVAGREASIYLGITIAEYYRDQGHRVALMIDSTSRWAEALREMGARQQEMPGEEGYPTYLASRLGQFLERAGCGEPPGEPKREGVVTILAAISPPSGDFSEPVTQAALRVAGALWALDPALAHRRHYPAVDWENSFSLYASSVAPWFELHAGEAWGNIRRDLLGLLQQERELRDIASLVGPEALEDHDHLVMDLAAMAREVLLRQNVFNPADAISNPQKTWRMAKTVVDTLRSMERALANGTPYSRLDLTPALKLLTNLRDGVTP